MTTVIRGHAGCTVHVRRATAADLEPVLAMLGRCSRETLYRRFHGVTDGTAYARQLLTAPAGHHTLGAWHGEACVAIATLAEGRGRWDVGVLVEDGWQRRGVGTSLLERLVGIARRLGIEVLDADVLAESPHVLRSLARIGTVDGRMSWGLYQVRVTLAASRDATTVRGVRAERPTGALSAHRAGSHSALRRPTSGAVAGNHASSRGTDPPMGNRYAVERVREGTRP